MFRGLVPQYNPPSHTYTITRNIERKTKISAEENDWIQQWLLGRLCSKRNILSIYNQSESSTFFHLIVFEMNSCSTDNNFDNNFHWVVINQARGRKYEQQMVSCYSEGNEYSLFSVYPFSPKNVLWIWFTSIFPVST